MKRFIALIIIGVLTGALLFSGCKKKEELALQDVTEAKKGLTIDLTVYGVEVEYAGNVAGTFLEDGSDEKLNNVFALKLKNITDNAIQYGEIILTEGDQTYNFTISTLPPGESLICEEMNRKAYKGKGESLEGKMQNVAWFKGALPLCEDVFEITGNERSILIKNISDKDVTGQVCVYYKYYDVDRYLGGITYRATLPTGIKAGATQVVSAMHYSKEGSKILFVTYVP